MYPRAHPLALVAFLLSIFAAAGPDMPAAGDVYQPLHRLAETDFPLFVDDMGIDSLIEATTRQIAYLRKQEPGKDIIFGADRYDIRWLLHSAGELLAKLQQQPEGKELNRFLQENYIVYQAGGRPGLPGRRMLVTGYYEPLFSGSLTREPPFLHPIYSPPESLVVSRDREGQSSIGRYNHNNSFVPYWTRAEIENNQLLRGHELAFLKDPFDAFLLHVQGSGRIQLPDQSLRSVRFAGSNGLAYNSIGKLLVDEKIMKLEEVSVPAIRTHLRRHPEQLQRILHHNPRFIFFAWGDNLSPKGSSGERLTPGRSIAIDVLALPGGTIGYLVTRRPVADRDGNITGWKPLTRFVFPQDTGAAIKGTGRVDLFWGSGDYAEFAANHMKEAGKLYFLVQKGYPGIQ